MSPETFDTIAKSAQLVMELAVTSGAAAMAVKWLQAKGIDTAAIQNNRLVGAAMNAAPTLLKDVMIQGKSITDPTVIADVEASLKASLTATHDATIASLKASPDDVARIAKNAVGSAVKNTLDATAQAASASVAPLQAVNDAMALVSAVKGAVAASPVATPPAVATAA
jgi:hypothetical protein